LNPFKRSEKSAKTLQEAGHFDHIVCFGALHFLDSVQFNAVLARMFMLARTSLTFEIDDLDDDYISEVKKLAGVYNENHVATLRAFGVPKGWKKIYDQNHYLYHSPLAKTDIFGYALRFEKEW
jgi:hypothetical protein